MKKEPEEIMRDLQIRLKNAGIENEIEVVAFTGTCYLRCLDPRLGKIRIADHQDKYGSFHARWQVRTDQEIPYREDYSVGICKRIYASDNLLELVEDLCWDQKTTELALGTW